MPDYKFKDADINKWPHHWMGTQEDIAYGKKVLTTFSPFIETLKQSRKPPSTINRHIDNICALGAWLITHLNYYPEDRTIEPYIHFLENIAGIDGPLIDGFSESQQNEFDATCRKFYKWMVAQGYELPPKPKKKLRVRKAGK